MANESSLEGLGRRCQTWMPAWKLSKGWRCNHNPGRHSIRGRNLLRYGSSLKTHMSLVEVMLVMMDIDSCRALQLRRSEWRPEPRYVTMEANCPGVDQDRSGVC